MQLPEWLKTAFPKPRIPQKRYIIAASFVIYWALKIYTQATPTTADDHLPDLFKQGVVRMVCDFDDKQETS